MKAIISYEDMSHFTNYEWSIMACMYRPISLAYILKLVNLRCMYWNDVTLEGLSKSVKHTKWPSELEHDEMNNEMMKP